MLRKRWRGGKRDWPQQLALPGLQSHEHSVVRWLGQASPTHSPTLATALLLVQLEPRLGVAPNELRPIDHMAEIECPVLVLSGAADAHTTAAETESIYAAAREPKELWLLKGAAHVDLHAADTAAYERRVGEFHSRHLASNR